jgi:DNA (cytosine-5)-methyltransferase 1
MSITVGSLFSGIGGLDLGLEQAGMKTVWQVEYDDWARGKLEENFPHTKKYKDVREVGKHNLEPVDLICGGFPCVDISVSKESHLRTGLDGDGSGLWSEMFRIVCELRPRYTLIENVANLLILDGHRVMSDLASIGLDAEWQVISAASFGLPIRRRRLFIFAKPESDGLEVFAAEKGLGNLYGNPRKVRRRPATTHIGDIGRTYPAIPEHLRVGNGLSYESSELKAMCIGYGNAVCPPVAKWIGERIVEFDNA